MAEEPIIKEPIIFQPSIVEPRISDPVILEPPIVLSEDVALVTESNRLPNVLGLVSVNVYIN